MSDLEQSTPINCNSRTIRYNGSRRGLPLKFPEVVERACRIVEEAVNAEMRKRQRFPLEWGGVHPSDGGEKVQSTSSADEVSQTGNAFSVDPVARELLRCELI